MSWIRNFDAKFALSKDEVMKLLLKCPTVSGTVDIAKFTTETWKTMPAGASSM